MPFTATAEGKARIHLVKYDTTGALLWDDVEVMPLSDDCAKAVKLKYYPYGQEIGTVTANDRAKFGTHTRDAATGLDYAMNRYYQSTWGRFTSPDPYRASGGPADPGSWNRYSYVQGDPVNYGDPSGLMMVAPYPPGYCPAQYTDEDCYGTEWNVWGYASLEIGGGGGSSGANLIDTSLERESRRLPMIARVLGEIVAIAARASQVDATIRYPSYLYVAEDCYGTDTITGTLERKRTYELRDQFGDPIWALIQESNFVIYGDFSSGALYSDTKLPSTKFVDHIGVQRGGPKREL